LALKIEGLDVVGATSPFRRLYDVGRQLMANKTNPAGLAEVLAGLGDGSVPAGMAKLFELIESIPGMQGITTAPLAPEGGGGTGERP